MRARLPVVVVHGGDRDEDVRGDVHEQPVQLLRARVVGDVAGGVEVADDTGPEVGEGGGDVLRLHRGERLGDGVLGHGWLPQHRAAPLITAAMKTPSNRRPVDRVQPPER
ncbi:hypothetical protein AMK30_32445 [Streptomyces sp. CB02460]|nr:hypothetical protein AMK30_32445 [Streptomyces sp. CB02460]